MFSLWLQMEAFALVFIVFAFHFITFLFIFIIFIFPTLISPLFICCFSICCNNSLPVCHVQFLLMYLKTPHLPPFPFLHISLCLVLTWTLGLTPSLFIIFIFTFVATILSFPIHCFCFLIVITRTLNLPYLSCSSLFYTCKRFRSSLFIHSIHLNCESFPFFLSIVFAFDLCLQELQTFPPFFFVLCLQKLSFFLFITFIYFYL